VTNLAWTNTHTHTHTNTGCSIQAAEAVARVVAGSEPPAPQQQQQQQQQQPRQPPDHTQPTEPGAGPASSYSNICSITVGMEMPVGGLLSKPGVPPLLDVDLSLVSAAYVTHTHTSVCETDGLKVLGAACGCIKGGLAISWITVMCVCACVCATL
jgi:hypothetical protein